MDCQDKNDRDLFNRWYVECALWSSHDESTPNGGEPMDKNYSADDIADDAKAKMTADCEAFMDANAEALKDYPAQEAGYDFWLTRNRHGSGFWEVDHGTEEQCNILTDSAHSFGVCDLYIGDDGKIYI